jgi:hypothetical protein
MDKEIEEAALIASAEVVLKKRIIDRLDRERRQHYDSIRAIDEVTDIVKDELSDYERFAEE